MQNSVRNVLTLALTAVACCSVEAIAAADPWTEGQTFQAVYPVANAGFGTSLAIDRDVLIIGHPRADAMGVVEAGAVEVWRHHATWTREATVFSETPLAGAHFGAAVAVSGRSLYVGAPDETNNGHANGGSYNFIYYNPNDGLWEASSSAPSTENNAHLGTALALQGNLFAASTPDSTLLQGGFVDIQYFEVQVSNDNYIRIKDPDSQLGDNFGASVALYRTDDAAYPDLLVVGAPFANQGSGAAYVYANPNHIGNAWTKVATLSNANPLAHEFFGTSVAVGRDHVVVGTPNRTKQSATPVAGAGSVSVFTRNGSGGWVLANEAFLPQAGTNDEMGFSVAYEPVSNRVFAGAPGRVINLFGGPGAAGAVEVFQYEKITGPFFAWKNTAEVTTEEQPSTSQAAGWSIAVEQGVVFSGAPDYDGTATNSGRVVMFTGDAIFANAFEIQ